MKTISNIILDKSIKETPFLKTAKDSDGNQITLSEQMAYLTHFIQNHKISHKLSYSQKALEIIKEVSEYLNATDEGNDIVSEPAVDYSYSLFSDIVHPRFPSVANPKFTFIDLFAGIGGFRIALQSLGGKCVFSSEWDANAQKTGQRRSSVAGLTEDDRQTVDKERQVGDPMQLRTEVLNL